jgi:hypothetical protein
VPGTTVVRIRGADGRFRFVRVSLARARFITRRARFGG